MASISARIKVRELVVSDNIPFAVGKNLGFVAKESNDIHSFVLYKIRKDIIYVTHIESLLLRQGLGTLLINRLKQLQPNMISLKFANTNLVMAQFLRACDFLCIGDTNEQYTFEWRRIE